MKILHICAKDDWQQATARGEYLADSLENEGFIHCSRSEQVEKVANSFYVGLPGLVLLHIDADRLTAEVKWEAADGDEFPHIYGPINLDAVVEIEEFEPGEDGLFKYPS
ncbi:MAG: DUF952 domain-containing protein [Chloroflexi bacterium]|nr:MAG: DUF952 domain-containing protein [Chloroflexota bacterium]MBL1194335.1 DUF952 domain-containing protein [Chloroflexota bacterium]NOH11625.1 DUF952 domain-containing protein [Chloroflexota bacterium]